MRPSVMRPSLESTNESEGNKSKHDETKLVEYQQDRRKTLNVPNVDGNGKKWSKGGANP